MKVTHVPAKLMALLLVLAGAVIIAAYYYSAAGGTLPLSGARYTVTAVVREPQVLLKHADVRAAGVKVGEVSNLTPVGGGAARVEMKLDKQLTPVYRDATVLVRQKTVVGENYVEIVRGDPASGALPDGAGLPIGQDKEAVPLDRILNSLDADTRRHISGNLRSLGAGWDGRGSDANRLLAALNPALADGSRVVGVLEAQQEQVADIVEQAGTVFEAISDRRRDMHSLIRSAKTTAESVAVRDRALREGFHEFPTALSKAKRSVAVLASLSGRETPVVADLRRSSVELRPVLRDLRPTADAGRALFAKLPALLKVADPALTELRGFSKVASPALPALDALLRQANPALAYLKPYSKDVGSFLMNFGALTQNDRFGSTALCSCPVSDQSFGNWGPTTRAAVGALLDQGVLAKIQHVAANPLRSPGKLPDAGTPWGNRAYPRLSATPATGKR